jgi:hypothetical protein
MIKLECGCIFKDGKCTRCLFHELKAEEALIIYNNAKRHKFELLQTKRKIQNFMPHFN